MCLRRICRRKCACFWAGVDYVRIFYVIIVYVQAIIRSFYELVRNYG